MYTDLFGRQSFICSGIKGKQSKNKLVYFQPLSLVEMDVYAKPKNEIFRIKEIKHDHPLYHISEDIRKSVIAMFISEFLYKTLHESESNQALFTFLISSIQLLDNMEQGVSNFHLVFLMQLSKHLGIFPQADFEEMAGIFTDQKIESLESEERFFSSSHEKLKENFGSVYKGSFQNIKQIKLNHKERLEILNGLIEFYKLHFNTIGNFKSLAVLEEIFKE